MATLASLVIGIGADPAALRSGLADSQQIIRRFAQSAQGATTSLQLFPNAGTQAVDAARQAVSGFEKEFNRDMALIRQRLGAGAISVSQFRVLGASAGNAFDAALSKELSKLEAAGQLTDALRQEMTAKFKQLGQSAGDVLKQEVEAKIRSIDAGSFATMGRRLTSIGQTLTTTVTAPLIALGGVSSKIASDAEETANKFSSIFGPAVAEATKEVEKLHRTIPATTDQLQEMTASMQALLVPMGIAPKDAKTMSFSLVKLAGDLASFNNIALTGTDGALSKIRSGLRGESEPMAQFGVDLRETALKAEALRQGMKNIGTTLTNQQRALAAYAIILRSTSIAQGDAERTMNSSANTMKFLARDFREAAVIIGRQLLPAIVPVARQLSGLLRTLTGINPHIVQTGIAFAAIAAALGPVLRFTGALIGIVTELTKGITILISRVALGGLAALLTPGGLVLLGLAAIAGAFALGAFQATRATRALAEFREGLIGLSQAQLGLRMGGLIDEIDKAERKVAELKAQIERREPTRSGLIMPFDNLQDQLDKAVASLNTLRGQQKAVADQFNEGKRAADQAAQEAERFRKALEEINKGVNQPVQTKFKTIGDQLKAQASIITDLLDVQEKRQIRINGLAEALVNTFHRADVELSKIKDPLSDQARDLQQVLTNLDNAIRGDKKPLSILVKPIIDQRALPQLKPIPVDVDLKPPPVNAFRDFEIAIERAITAENALKLARLAGTPEERAAAEQALKNNLVAVTIAQQALASSVQKGTANFDEQAQALAVIDAGMARLQRQTEKTTKASERISNALRGVVGVSRGLIGVADAMGRIGDSARESLGNVVNLLSAVEDLATSLASGNLFSIASSGAGVLGSVVQLFAGLNRASEEEMRAREEQLQQQARLTESIAKMRDAMDGFTGAIQSQLSAVKALRFGEGRAPIPGRGASSIFEFLDELAKAKVNVLNKPSGFTQLDNAFRTLGTSLSQLIKFADDLGITLFDNAGHIIPGAFQVLAKAIEQSAKDATRFGNTLSDVSKRIELERNVFNLPDDAQASIQQGLKEMAQLAPDLFRQFFSGVDLNSAQQVEAALQALTKAFLANELDWKKFGDLFGKEDLITIIETVAGGLDGLRQATESVTESLLGLPSGYKIAKARFDATVAETAQTLASVLNRINAPGAIQPPPRAGDIPTTGAVRATSSDQAAVTQAVFVFREGSIQIDAKDKPAAEIFDEVKVEAQRRARQLGPNRPASDALDF